MQHGGSLINIIWMKTDQTNPALCVLVDIGNLELLLKKGCLNGQHKMLQGQHSFPA